jgi:hypothetical protein
MAVTANCGVRPFSVSIITGLLSESPSVRQIPPGFRTDAGFSRRFRRRPRLRLRLLR